MTGTPRKLLSPRAAHQSRRTKRSSRVTSGTSRLWRRSAIQPRAPSPYATGAAGKPSAMASSDTARRVTVWVTSSATQKETKGAPIISAAARAMVPRTSLSSSEEETTWLTRESARSRMARPSRASRSRA